MLKIESKGHADDTYVFYNGKLIDGIESIELSVRVGEPVKAIIVANVEMDVGALPGNVRIVKPE